MKYYLAVDIGASSGRHILAHLENGRIILEEIYRFYNGMDTKNGHQVWDTDRLFSEILTGMKKCKEIGKVPETMGIDTWGVDFVLLDNLEPVYNACAAEKEKHIIKGAEHALSSHWFHEEYWQVVDNFLKKYFDVVTK